MATNSFSVIWPITNSCSSIICLLLLSQEIWFRAEVISCLTIIIDRKEIMSLNSS